MSNLGFRNRREDRYRFEGVVAICTRGALLTQVLEGIEANITPRALRGLVWAKRTTWDLPIPDAQNAVTAKALELQPDYIWYVEEDTVPPPGALQALMFAGRDVAVIEYRMDDGSSSVCRLKDGSVGYAGMGCMLVTRRVLTVIKQPWFDTTPRVMQEDGSFATVSGVEAGCKQDVSFFAKAHAAGYQAAVVPGLRCKHLRIDKLGERGPCNGLHQVREL